MNTALLDERQRGHHERPQFAASGDVLVAASESDARIQRHVAAAIIILFWIGQFALISVYMQLTQPQQRGLLLPRALICGAGAILSCFVLAAQNRLKDQPLRIRAYW